MAIINGVQTLLYNVKTTQDLEAGDDVEVGDDLILSSGGTITNAAGQLVINPTTYTSIGTGSPGAATGAGDLYVQDTVEVGGDIYVANTKGFFLGASSNDSRIAGSITQDDVKFVLGSNHGRQLVLTDYANRAYDHGHAASADPILYGHSVTASQTEWWSITHDQTDAVVGIGSGGHVTNHEAPTELADDGTLNLPDATAGIGFLLVGDGEEYAQWAWDSTGVVDLIVSSGNVVASDTDTKFCVYDGGGTQVVIKNRLGSAKKVLIDYHYTTP